MKNTAYVKEISGANAVLKIKRECACDLKDRCGAKCFTLADDMLEAEINNNIGAKAGDYVEIESNTRSGLIYAACAFILPVIAGIILYFITASYIISGAGFILSVIIINYIINNTAKKRKAGDFKITRIININRGE